MKKTTFKKEIRHPRDAAIELARSDMMYGKIIYMHLSKTLFKETSDYTAYVDVKTKCIIVSKFYGVSIHESYPVYAIMQEVLKEIIPTLNEKTKVFSWGKKQSDSVF